MTVGLERAECQKSLSKVILNIIRGGGCVILLERWARSIVGIRVSHLSDNVSYREKIKNVRFQQSLTIVPDRRFVTLLKNKTKQKHTPTQAPKFMPDNTKKKKIQAEAGQPKTAESPQPRHRMLIPTSESRKSMSHRPCLLLPAGGAIDRIEDYSI